MKETTKNDSKQLKFVTFLMSSLSFVVFLYAYIFWNNFCDSNLDSCLGNNPYTSIPLFLLISIIRPTLFTPLAVLAVIGGETFGTFLGTILITLGATVSALVLYLPSKYLGEKYLHPWLSSNLPDTLKLLRTQDYKVVFASRWIPIIPFDLMSIFFGVGGFRVKSVIWGTLVGVLPEAYIFSLLSSSEILKGGGIFTLGTVTIVSVSILSIITLTPLLIYEVINKHSKNSLLQRAKKTFEEIRNEIVSNNIYESEFSYEEGSKTPVLLLYGFFTSKKGTKRMKDLLEERGHPVMTFNLGGLFGVYNTRNIKDLAKFVNYQVKEKMLEHNFNKINVVAHSKGGLVALWWILKLGGHKYCDNVITMGTPFKGAYATYLALMTPLGMVWRDVWQMRPGSEFLRDLHSSSVPTETNIFCFYSSLDRVSRDKKAVFEPYDVEACVVPVPMHHITHFDFQLKEEVANKIDEILSQKYAQNNYIG